jgi:hypothetical protein
MHHAVKPCIRPILPRILAHLATLLEARVVVVAAVETVLECVIAGARAEAKECNGQRKGCAGGHGAGMKSRIHDSDDGGNPHEAQEHDLRRNKKAGNP